VAGGCYIEPPYFSDDETTPFAVTLTSDTPVAVRDIVFERDALPTNGTASAKLELHDVDPRVRVVVTGEGDIDENAVADGLGAIAPRNRKGDIVANLQTRLLCPEETCDLPQRIILELTNPAPDESVSVAGDIVVGYGYPGASPLPGPAVKVSGHDAGEARPPSTQATTRVAGTLPDLDVDHPVALLPVHLTVEGGDGADAINFASETRVSLGNVPPGAVDVVIYELRPDPKEFQSAARLLYRPSPLHFAPFLGCELRKAVTCEHDAVLRFAWTGTDASVPLDYEVETIVTGFGPPAAAITATIDPARPIAVPAGAPVLTTHHEGTIVLDNNSQGGGESASFRLVMLRFPPASDPVVLEVPGVVLLTYSAVGRDGPGPSDDPNARVHVSGVSNLEYFEFPTDGRERTIALPLFGTGVSANVGIRPVSMRCEGAECAVDFRLDLHHSSARGVELPITMSYRFDVRATSFDSAPLPKDALVWLGPEPTTAP
jgi:hypothetical protein